MATLTATAAQANSPAMYNVTGTTSRTVFFTHNVALSAGDVIQFVRVPSGAQIQTITTSHSFSAGVVTGDFGYGGDISAFGAAVALSGGPKIQVNNITLRGVGYSFSAEDTIDFVVSAISAPPATATIVLQVTYSNQG